VERLGTTASSAETVEVVAQSLEEFGVALVNLLSRHVGLQIETVNGGQSEDEDQKCGFHSGLKIELGTAGNKFETSGHSRSSFRNFAKACAEF
jgi:hypothetical protein